MVSEVVRAGIGSVPTPAQGIAPVRARLPAERFVPSGEVLDHETLAPDAAGSGRSRQQAWTAYRRAVALEDIRPRAGFAAQLMSQADPGVRAHYEDLSSMIAAYTTAEQRPARAAVGSTVSIEL